MGIGAVTSAVGPPESEDAQMLIGATFREQLGRHMLSWGVDESDPPLPARLKPLFDYLGWTMVAGEDRKNREKLRGYMAEKGWLTLFAVREKAAHAEWVCAQYADDDCARQVSAQCVRAPMAQDGGARGREGGTLNTRH